MKQIHKFLRMYQELLVSAGLLVAIVVGVAVGVVPAVKKIISLRAETSSLAKEIDALRVKANTLEAADEDTYKQYLAQLAYAVPPDKSLTSVFSTIDGLGNLTGATLSDFNLIKPGALASESARRISTEEKQVGSNFLPFTLTVTGSYSQIRDFLEQSIRVRRFFRVRYFDIFFETDQGVSAKMGMDAFYAPLPTRLGSTAQPVEPLSETDEKTIADVVALPILSQDVFQQVPQSGTLAPEATVREDPFAP